MWLSHLVQRNGMVRPERMALSDATRRFTWGEVDRRTNGIAAAVTAMGLSRGARVLVLSGNRAEVVELYLAMAKAGVIACPVNPVMPWPEIEWIIGNVKPQGVFAERAVLERLGEMPADWTVLIGEDRYEAMACDGGRPQRLPHPGDAAMIFSTAATTGRPKAVVVSHRSIQACYVGMAAETGMSETDVMLNPCPLFHGSTVIGLALLAAGGHLAIERDFTPQRFLADVTRLRPTRAFLVPSMIRFVLAARAFGETDLSCFREIMHGGAPMPEELLREALLRLPCRLRSVYGITEGGGPIALLASDELHPAGAEHGVAVLPAGRMMPGAHIAILDESGNEVPAGDMGEVCVRGDGVMDGYWENEAATRAALADGWLRTGDLGYMDRDGYVFLIDRKNDLIIRGGQNVYPAEIERVIRKQSGVLDVAAVGMPSSEWGEVPVAFVVAEKGVRLDPVALIVSCTNELASYKRPVAVHLVEEIPRSAAGKVLRRELRKHLGTPERNSVLTTGGSQPASALATDD